MTTAVVFIGGDAPHPSILSRLPTDRLVIAADSGYDHAHELGIPVDVVVGDMDSVSAVGLDRMMREGPIVEKYPADKDHTDTELALRSALDRGVSRIMVISSNGDRLDHSIGALASLAAPHLAEVEIEAWWGDTRIHVLHGPTEQDIAGTPGATVSLLPIGGPAHGVVLTGTRYTLSGETLSPTSSRALSNVFEQDRMHVAVRTGTLLVFIPPATEGPTP